MPVILDAIISTFWIWMCQAPYLIRFMLTYNHGLNYMVEFVYNITATK